MKHYLHRSILGVALACFAFAVAPNLMAAAGASTTLLEQAYTALQQADHDYQGHRAAAMKQIEAAAKELGTPIANPGKGKGHEKQKASDDQLRAAEGYLQQAKSGLTGKPLHHVEKALAEIAQALKVK